MIKKSLGLVIVCCIAFNGYMPLYSAEAISDTRMSHAFTSIFSLLQEKDYFSARERFEREKELLSEIEIIVINVYLDNAFNRLESSNAGITILESKYKLDIQNKKELSLPRDVLIELDRIASDNAVKQFRYSEAQRRFKAILEKYSDILSSDDMKSYQESLEIWTVAATTPPQETIKTTAVSLSIKRDKAGLRTIPIQTNKGAIDFVFDTGANLSTVPESTALLLDMKLLPGEISVHTGTGDTVRARLAVCPSISVGTIEVKNALFIVLQDEELTFPQINYRINGIIGYPIMSSFGEFTLTRKGKLEIPRVHSNHTERNLALNDLMPLIALEGKPYIMDTGATTSILFRKYFDANKDWIEKKGKRDRISLGGAGGQTLYDGYRISFNPVINGKKSKPLAVPVLIEDFKSKSHLFSAWGIIGQDLLGKYKSMTVNFNEMFVRFE